MASKPIHCPASARSDRKLIERNRRNEMKALFSTLNSLVPNNQSSKEAKTVPDQIENATNYIKEMQRKVEKLKEKRDKVKKEVGNTNYGPEEEEEEEEEDIRRRRRSSGRRSRRSETNPKLLVKVEAHQVAGSSMEVFLATGSDYHFLFTQILRLIHQHGAHILNINHSVFPDRVFHKIIAQVGEEGIEPEDSEDCERICEAVKKFVSQYKDGQCTL